jgi:hypothetical protein
VSSLIDGAGVSSALDPSLVRFAPPRRFLATPVLRSCAGDVSPFNNGASSISEVAALEVLFVSRGRSDGGIGRL